MDAMKAHERLTILDNRIESLNDAYNQLWRDFDSRVIALELNKIQADYEEERAELVSKLSAVKL